MLMCPLSAKGITTDCTVPKKSDPSVVRSWLDTLTSRIRLVDTKNKPAPFKTTVPHANLKAELAVNNVITPALNARLGVQIYQKSRPFTSPHTNTKKPVGIKSLVQPSFLFSVIYYFSPQNQKKPNV